MNPLARYKSSTNLNHPCPDLVTMAERELSAFFKAITHLFGSEQAELSAEDWLQELTAINHLPASTGEWRSITTKVSTRLALRVNASSPSTDYKLLRRKRICAFLLRAPLASSVPQSSGN
jgi:hypothetical protein